MSSNLVREIINSEITESEPMSSALAHVTQDEKVDALTDAGYVIRYQQTVLDHPNGGIAIVEVEPA